MKVKSPCSNVLEASIKVSRCAGHDGLDEEGLLAATLLVASNDAEAPALIVALLQDDVAAPVHVAWNDNVNVSGKSTLHRSHSVELEPEEKNK